MTATLLKFPQSNRNLIRLADELVMESQRLYEGSLYLWLTAIEMQLELLNIRRETHKEG